MKELFLPYELAVIAKEKGFNEDCFNCYESNGDLMGDDYYAMVKRLRNNNPNPLYTPAPLYQQIVDWFRENHGYILFANQAKQNKIYKWTNRIGIVNDPDREMNIDWNYYDNYYEAFNKAIEEAFKLI